MFQVQDQLSKMEEARKPSIMSNEKVGIIIDKQLTIREKAYKNTRVIFPRPSPTSIKVHNTNTNINTNTKKSNHLIKCADCYCDMEKIEKFRDDDDDGMYYCSQCWNRWNGDNVNQPDFTDNWGYEYEKVEFDY